MVFFLYRMRESAHVLLRKTEKWDLLQALAGEAFAHAKSFKPAEVLKLEPSPGRNRGDEGVVESNLHGRHCSTHFAGKTPDLANREPSGLFSVSSSPSCAARPAARGGGAVSDSAGTYFCSILMLAEAKRTPPAPAGPKRTGGIEWRTILKPRSPRRVRSGRARCQRGSKAALHCRKDSCRVLEDCGWLY